jgi:hypothetical protein
MRSVNTPVVDLVAEVERLIDAGNQGSVPYKGLSTRAKDQTDVITLEQHDDDT